MRAKLDMHNAYDRVIMVINYNIRREKVRNNQNEEEEDHLLLFSKCYY